MNRPMPLGDDDGMTCPDCGADEVYGTDLDDESGRVQYSCEECDYVETTESAPPDQCDRIPF